VILWIAIGLISAAAVAILVAPMLRRAAAPPPRAGYDLAVYRDQLAELDRDQARGLLSAEERAAARTEIERRMLEAADRDAAPAAPPLSASTPRRTLTALVAVLAPAAAIALYLAVGSPSVTRHAASVATESIPREQIEQMIQRLVAHLREAPDDARGWSMLGRSYAMMGRYEEAISAYERAEPLAPRDADLVSRHAEARILADNGTVGEAARRLIDRALALDGRDARARYFRGMAEAQAGRRREALDIWLELERDSEPGAPWRAAVAQRIDETARALGLDPKGLPGHDAEAASEPSAPRRGPSEQDMASASQMAPEQRAAMVRGMVAKLAEKLEKQPNDAEGWMRLGQSYGVLGEAAKSRDAWRRAAELRPDDPEALGGYASAMLEFAGDAAPPPEFARVAATLLRVAPEHPDALWFGGMAASARGDTAQAVRYWRILLERLPAESPAREEVARAIAEVEGKK